MKIALVASIAVFVALIGTLQSVDAAPQRYHIQKLPYYPPRRPHQPPRPIRVRRDVALGGSLSSNPAGGADAKLEIAKGFGTPETNIIASGIASGNTNGGPVATSGTLAANHKGLGASITKEHLPGVRDTLTKTATANFFNTGTNKLDGSIFKENTKLANGFEFDKKGGALQLSNINGHSIGLAKETIPGISDTLTKTATANLFNNGIHNIDAKYFDTRTKFTNGFSQSKVGGELDWAHVNGHSANLGLTKYDLGSQLNLGAKSNLWTSPDKSTSLGITGGASRWLSGPMSGKNDFGFGLGLNSHFG